MESKADDRDRGAKAERWGKIIVGAIMVIMCGVVAAGIFGAHRESWRDITICSKDSIHKDWGTQYFVFAADDPYVLKSNSNPDNKQAQAKVAAMYNTIQNKTSYHVKIKGHRVREINMMPDILELEKLPPSQQHPELCTP